MAALVGCASPLGSVDVTPNNKSRYTLVQEPPAQPPIVTANRTDLTVTQYQWWSDGGPVEHLVTDPSTVPLPEVKTANGKIVFSIGSDVRPYQLVLSLFNSLGPDGLPVSDTGEQIDCLSSPRCKVAASTQKKLEFEVSGVAGGQVAMLQIGYLKLIGESGSSSKSSLTLSASWTLRTVETR